MTRKQAKKTMTPKHPKWTSQKMALHNVMKEYCNDAKQQYLDVESFKKVTARLTTRTGWKL